MMVVVVSSSSTVHMLGFSQFIYAFCFLFMDLQLKFESYKVVFLNPINAKSYFLLACDNLVLPDFYCMWHWQS